MKRLFSILILAGICGALQLIAADRQLLHDGWRLRQARMSNEYPAEVPGTVHLDLIRDGLIEDPFQGLNERAVQWVDKEDWIYETAFTPADSVMNKNNINIVFKGLDTYADVYLNEQKIISADNMFREWSADIKHLLVPGLNRLKIHFHSPIKVDMPKWESLPYHYDASNDQSENGGIFDRKLSVFARKAGYHYGWDWGPRLVTSGIWRDVYIEGWDNAVINNVFIRQHKVMKEKAEISDIVEISADRRIENAEISVTDDESGKVLCSEKIDLNKGLNHVSLDFNIKKPRLWWCNGLGTPELYNLTTKVTDGDEILSSVTTRVGLRSVSVVTSPDSDGNMQFYFVLNGVPVFAKGTNYIPQDSFLPRVTDDKYKSTLKDAVDANMNMIRIWGGGIYENDIFYDLCDELGLMVWQDFMFACSIYPASGEWLENIREEAAYNVRRLRNHPSVVLWCGGNECIDAWYNWGWKYNHEKSNPEYTDIIEKELYRQYFETLPAVVGEFAPEAFYWPSSPFSANGRGSDGINGDRHYWDVWHQKAPIDSYNKDRAHFFSEYGMQSFPEYESILKFAPDTADHRITSDVMMSHQRGGDHANELIEWYLLNEYRKPGNFEEFLYLNQVLQADALRTAIEAHRRDRPYCMGSLIWQHNDCWPVASWSTRDYYGNWKAAHYMIREAFKNVIVSAETTEDNLRVYVVSDITKAQSGKIRIRVMTLNGEEIFNQEVKSKIPANTSTIVFEKSLAEILGDNRPEDVVVNLRLECGEHRHEGNHYLCKQKNLNLHQADIKYHIEPVAGGYRIDLSSDKFVRALNLSLPGSDVRFSENYIDLIPGETKSCTLQTDLSLEKIKKQLKLKSLNQSY